VVVPVPRVSSVVGTSEGTAGIGVVGAGPQLGDDTGSLLWDLVMHDTIVVVPGSAVPGDAALAPGSLVAAGPGVSGLYLLGSPGFPSPPIN
jgi:hypothetical protein